MFWSEDNNFFIDNGSDSCRRVFESISLVDLRSNQDTPETLLNRSDEPMYRCTLKALPTAELSVYYKLRLRDQEQCETT